MINKIGVENRNVNSVRISTPNNSKVVSSPSFKGGPWSALLWGIQECEKNPMINVAVVDMFSAILPRTFVESLTNWFAGFEAFRRESSGLIVNCLIPSVITCGAALGLNKMIMPKGTDMASCWADNSLINRATEISSQLAKSENYNLATNKLENFKESLKEIIRNTEGYHGKNKVIFRDVLTEAEIEKYAKELSELTKDKSNKQIKEATKRIAKEIADKTHVYENIALGGGKSTVKASTVKTLLEDSVKFFKGFNNVAEKMNINEFAQKSKKLVKSKSAIGMLIVLPLAASMQYINRWITEKMSGTKGAPIYEDFGKEQNEEVRKKSQEGLLKQKIISITSMIGVGLLSMMKKPSWNMFEFKGWFPTMDQARIISTTTFASRMAAADDKNELAESTVRDIATFSGLYFLGDYAGKATATIIENKTGVQLLNDTKPISKDANIIKRFWHWVKDVNIKSSEEVISKTKEALKGATPTPEQEKQIAKELKRATNLRSACQVANLGVSLVLLGLIIPIFTRSKTKKKHEEAIKMAQNNASPSAQEPNDLEKPLNRSKTK